MKSITEIVKPIKLLAGSHANTGKTGQGCIMNVIAYLNGEPQITDQSPCVCKVVRPMLIRFNDFLKNDERQELIPFIERAMGSATNDKDEIKRRLLLLVDHGKEQEAWWRSNTYAYANANAKAYANTYANANAYAYANANANAYAYDYANAYANADANANAYAYANAYAPYREQYKKSVFKFLDAALPKAQIFPDSVLKRAEELACLA